MLRNVIAIALLVASSLTFASDFYNGQKLHRALQAAERVQSGNAQSREDVADGFAADGYVEGVVDTMTDPRICLPHISVGQIKKMVLNHLDASPEDWQFDAHLVIMAVLLDKYPCQK